MYDTEKALNSLERIEIHLDDEIVTIELKNTIPLNLINIDNSINNDDIINPNIDKEDIYTRYIR